MNTLKIRDLVVGEGAPKIIVPIVGKTMQQILDKADELKDYTYDAVEWRVDFYEHALDTGRVLEVAGALRTALGKTPILFTFRTAREGGEQSISPENYTALNKAVAESGYVDLIDVEIFAGEELVRENIANIHAAGVAVVGSNHEFEKTPDKADLLYRLRKMQDMGADIPKIAVMPQSKADVITLLDATQEMYTKYADRPIITMSMGPAGVISRLSGEAFGSAMTFGAVGQVSAPGQIPVERLRNALQILHTSC